MYIQKETPSSPVVNNIFVNTSTSPISAKIYQDSSWVDFNDVYLGYVTVSSNAITNVKCANLNDNGFNINKSNITFLKNKYSNGYSGYRIYSDGYCEQWGYVTSNSSTSVSISFLKTFSNSYYNLQTAYKGTASTNYPIVITAYSASSFTAYQYTLNNSNYKSAIYWRASGYLASGQY